MNRPAGLRARVRREVLGALVIAVAGFTIHALMGPGSEGNGGLSLLESLLLSAVLVVLIRVVATVRKTIRTAPASSLDRVGLQPGEVSNPDTPQQERPSGGRSVPARVTELEGMVRVAVADPDYFESTLKPLLDGLFGETAETIALEPVPRNRLAFFTRSRAMARNVERIRRYVDLVSADTVLQPDTSDLD